MNRESEHTKPATGSSPWGKRPDIGVALVSSLPDDILTTFVENASHPKLDIQGYRPPPPGPYAASEWFIPTAMVVYVFKPYFSGFLKEAGKDHYHKVAAAVASIWPDVFGPARRLRATLIATSPNKAEAVPTYSREFSLMSEAGPHKFKLLLGHEASLDAVRASAVKFLDFVERCHAGSVVVPEAYSVGGVVLVTLDPASATICFVDGRTGSLHQP